MQVNSSVTSVDVKIEGASIPPAAISTRPLNWATLVDVDYANNASGLVKSNITLTVHGKRRELTGKTFKVHVESADGQPLSTPVSYQWADDEALLYAITYPHCSTLSASTLGAAPL